MQVVPAFEDPSGSIRELLWVETEFDSDGDGRLDRVFADVTRPGQTETEGLNVLVISKTGTELTLDLDATSLRLPVVGGRDWFDETVGDGL